MLRANFLAAFLITAAIFVLPVNLIASPKQVVSRSANIPVIQAGTSLGNSRFDSAEYFYQAPDKKKPKPIKGELLLDSGSSAVRFVTESGTQLDIPFNTITKIIYERTSKPRYAEAILLSPLFLFSKSKSHFLTLQYKGADGQGKFALLRLDKKNYQSVLAATESQTGTKVERIEEK